MKTRPTIMMLVLAFGLASCGQISDETPAGWKLDSAEENHEMSSNGYQMPDDAPVYAPNSTNPPDSYYEFRASPFATCERDEKWSTWEDRFWYEPGLFDFTPNDGLIIRAEAIGSSLSGYRATDGFGLSGVGFGAMGGVDRSWSTGVVATTWNRDLEVRSVVTGEALFTQAPPAEQEWTSSAISPSGELIAGLSCGYGPNGTSIASVHVLSVGSPAPLHVLDFGDLPCRSWSGARVQLAFAPDDSALFVGEPATGKLTRVEVIDGARVSVDAHETKTLEDGRSVEQALTAIAVDPIGEWVVTTGADDRLRVFDARTLSPLREVNGVGAFVINEMTYAPPMITSPVAFSKSGDLLAWTGWDRQTFVADRSGKVIVELPMPDDEDFHEQWGMTNDPTQIAFSNDGRELAIAYYFGVALTGCETSRERREGALPVTLEGPATVRIGEVATFVATDLAPSLAPHAHSFLVDGSPFHQRPDSPRTLEWYPGEAGAHEIEVIIDDGISSGSARMTVNVLPEAP